METTNIASNKLDHIISQGVKLTPMMKQYHEIKKEYPDILVLFRMGDFYELFFEDAEEASKLLNITLTHRGKLGGFPIPMAGIPFHAAGNYVDRITQQGLKAAICEQVEDPKIAKGIVKRAVTQVASPAMPFDIEKVNEVDYHFIASANYNSRGFFLTLIDYTTGHFLGHHTTDFESFLEKLQLYAPREFISFFDQWENYPKLKEYLDHYEVTHTHLTSEYFETKYNSHYTQTLIPNFKTDKTLEDAPAFLEAVGALSYYITSTQAATNYQHIKPFKLIADKDEMKVTMSTLSGLEILPKSRERYKHSLLGFMDKTKSSLGTRKLRSLFLSPSRDLKQLNLRQNYIESLIQNSDKLDEQREQLESVRDIERVMAKVSTGNATASDLINLSRTTSIGLKLSKELNSQFTDLFPKFTAKNTKSLKTLIKEIDQTLNDQIGAALEKGNLIKEGFHKKRDKLAKLAQGSNQALLDLEAGYREKYSIANLRIKSNNVAGFFIEISKSHINKVPDHFVRRQTLVNCERYICEELAELEKEIFSAREKLGKLEREIFQGILDLIKTTADSINVAAEFVSLTDAFQSLAWIAIQEGFSKPQLQKSTTMIDIEHGFHPLIKKELGDHFVTHSLALNSKKSFGLVTGPNMAGKTTVMREMAIIQFLAQIGSYVPAKSAQVGLCDYLFSRLGASDDIIKGQSTFMVEMSETAEILRHATSKSFIILDEIGRGTSTYDGLSIAWALVEYITSQIKCLALFSTHYHELIQVVDEIANAKNLTVKTHKQGQKVVFLYELIEQGATQSFGINVASLAGIPSSILKRAEEILLTLEKSKHSPTQQMNLFNNEQAVPTIETAKESWLEKSLSELDLNDLTPLQALNQLSEWKERAKRLDS